MRNTDLEHLTFIELLEEKVKVKAEISEMIAEKRVSGRPDDVLYRKWLRRMNARLSECVARHDEIRLMLAKRQQEGAKSQLRKPSPMWTAEQQAQRAALVADLQAGGADGLLLRIRRLMTNLCGGIPIDQLPIDETDRLTLRDTSIYLRRRYGSRNLKDALHEVSA